MFSSSLRAICLFAPIALVGCGATVGATLGTSVAGAGTGYLQGVLGAAQSGGSLTPITNIGNALTLQELANAHNTVYSAQQILNSTGPVTIAMPPGTIVTPAPSPVMPAPMPTPVPVPTPVPTPVPPGGGPPSFPTSPPVSPP